VSRHEVHNINTHTLHNASRQKQTKQVSQGIGAGILSEDVDFRWVIFTSEAPGPYPEILKQKALCGRLWITCLQ